MSDVAHRLAAALETRYRLEREVGAGGMATVYLAHDLKHERDVAIKVLHPDLGAALGAERFLAEIKTTAKLQHPNILPLLDSGAAEGLLYYVMPFVRGETLRARLERERQLPVADAIRLTTDVAAALDHAHRQGIIHRDIKPENVLLQDGAPLVADFGIALAVQHAGGQRITQTGISLGTPSYMSPEQATGDRIIDARSDVYALGAITYEMLTGEPPHTGSTAQAIIARLMTERPPSIRTTRPAVPPAVEAAVERALEKLPADRWISAKEFAQALQAVDVSTSGERSLPTGEVPAAAGRSRRLLHVALGTTLGAAAAAAVFLALAPRSAPESSVAFDVVPPAGVSIMNPPGRAVDISADGRTVAFLGADTVARTARVYIRRLDDVVATPLNGTEPAQNPVFGPDGETVIFKSPNAIMRTSVRGEAPTVVVSSAIVGTGMGWGLGTHAIIAAGDSLFSADPSSADRRVLSSITRDRSIAGFSNPMPLGDGRTVAVRVNKPGARLAMIDAAGGPLTMVDVDLGGTLGNVVGFADNVLLLGLVEGSIVGLPFDLGARKATGPVVRLLDGVSAKNAGGANARLAANGTLVYMLGASRNRIWLLGNDGKLSGTPLDDWRYAALAWSPDGRRLAATRFQLTGSTASELWVLDVASGGFNRIVDGAAADGAWSPDGRRLAFERSGEQAGVYVTPIDGSALPQRVRAGNYSDPFFTPDGRALVVSKDSLPAVRQLVRVPLDGTSPEQVLVTSTSDLNSPSVSPDGRWLAYADEGFASSRVYVTSMQGGGGRVLVSPERAFRPRWSSDGRRLYFSTVQGRLMVASLEFTDSGVTVGRTVPALPLVDVADAEMHPDGKRYAALRNGSGEGLRIIVHTNWWQSVRERMHAGK